MIGRRAAALFAITGVSLRTGRANSGPVRTGLGEPKWRRLARRLLRALRPRLCTMLLIGPALLLAMPALALAHGPVAPVATSYLARVSRVPAGLEAKVVDGYVRMWLRVPPTQEVTVLDYSGAPYVRFSRSGVEVNHNSAMWYLNQTPVAGVPPADLSRTTPPHWYRVNDGHDYEWHDGRLQALASVALAPGTTYLGTWNVPLLINGRPTAVTGALWHADAPSPLWFWPIVVLLACVIAGRRVRRPTLDARVARALGIAALAAITVAALSRGLHGRPNLDPFSLIELAATLAFCCWGLRVVTFRRAGYFTYFMIAFVAIWEGLDLLPTLLHAFVLVALPAFLNRTATVICLGAAVGILLLVFRLADQRDPHPGSAGNVEIDQEGLEESYDVG